MIRVDARELHRPKRLPYEKCSYGTRIQTWYGIPHPKISVDPERWLVLTVKANHVEVSLPPSRHLLGVPASEPTASMSSQGLLSIEMDVSRINTCLRLRV
jgi:hypothetical protein